MVNTINAFAGRYFCHFAVSLRQVVGYRQLDAQNGSVGTASNLRSQYALTVYVYRFAVNVYHEAFSHCVQACRALAAGDLRQNIVVSRSE